MTTKYEVIDEYATTYSVWAQLLTYGKRGLGMPAIEWEPAISGLLKSDAEFWALGKAYFNPDWKVVKNTLFEKTESTTIVIEDKLGAKWSFHVTPDVVQRDGTVTVKPTAPIQPSIKPRVRAAKKAVRKAERR